MKIQYLGMYLLCGWSLFFTYPVYAEHVMQANSLAANSLSLDEAIELSIQKQPLLQSFEAAAKASRRSAVAEAQLPDPKVKLGIINLPATNSDAFRFDREPMTMTSIGLEQEMVPQAKREAVAKYLDAEARQYETEQLANQRSIQKAVAIAWLETYAAQHKSALYHDIIETMQAEREAGLGSASAGAKPLSDILKLDAQLASARDKALMARLEEKKARAGLARWLGDDANRQLSDKMHLYTPPSLKLSMQEQRSQLEANPELMSALQQEVVAVSDLDRAQLGKLSNWSWEVGYGKRFAAGSDMVTVQVAFELQTDRAHRQDQRSAEKQLLLDRARKLTQDRRLELMAALESARADWEISEAREQEHQHRLIPAADARLKLLEAGYRAGKSNLAEVWEAKRTVLEIQIEHLNILTERQRAAINLAFLLNDEHFFTAPSTTGGRP